MIFLARLRNQQHSDANAPTGESHPTGTIWHAAPGTPVAWPLPIACIVAELARPTEGGTHHHFAHRQVDGPTPAGMIGPHSGHVLTLAPYTGAIKVRALRSRRVVLHADRHYYGPLGLPLPSARFHHWLSHERSLLTRLDRRVSLVPNQTLRACNFPYPGGSRRRLRNSPPDRHGLRREMSDSAPP